MEKLIVRNVYRLIYDILISFCLHVLFSVLSCIFMGCTQKLNCIHQEIIGLFFLVVVYKEERGGKGWFGEDGGGLVC